MAGSPQAAEALTIAWFEWQELDSLANDHTASTVPETAAVRRAYARWCERGNRVPPSRFTTQEHPIEN